MMTTVLSVLFSGVVAAILTFLLSRSAAKGEAKARAAADANRDAQQQAMLEDWEHRKYKANQKLYSLRLITELFYSARNEIYFLGLDLTNADALLAGADRATEQYLLQNNPQITAKDLAAHKTYLMAQQQQQVAARKISRLDQYNNAVKGIQARAQAEVSVASHYVSRDLLERLEHLYKTLSQKIDVGTIADVAASLKTFDGLELEFRQLQKGILGEVDTAVRTLAVTAGH